jgi:predicted CXXCH cytochrome family protein
MRRPLALFALGLFFIRPAICATPCADCHSMTEKKVIHSAAEDSCLNCHQDKPWDSAEHGKLSETGNGLCIQCHDEQPLLGGCVIIHGVTRCGHPIVNHPINASKDPLYPKKEFGCVSCHNPHSSDMPKLFRYNYGSQSAYQGQLCAVCHWAQTFSGPAPKTPAWN